MKNVTAVLSMLHEDADRNSATRLFRGEPVLRWTFKRLARAKRIESIALICWEEQLNAIAAPSAEAGAFVLAKGPRVELPGLAAITAARRWSDGWRGGLLGTCDFDLGFHAPWYSELAERIETDGLLLIDPAAAMVDPAVLDGLVEHALSHPDAPLVFVPTAPGLGGTLMRRDLIDRLAPLKTHAGKLLHYLPDQLSREPLASDACAPAPLAAVRTPHRFKLDSDRQISRLGAATVSLNGQLISSSAEEIVRRLHAWDAADPLPREVVLEINTNRSTKPIFAPAGVTRPGLTIEQAKSLFAELAGLDDTRLTFAGLGDPLLHPDFFELIHLAHEQAGVAIHVETDLHAVDAYAVARLAAAPVDVVSVHLPALTPETYAAVMGVDGYIAVMENLRAFLAARQDRAVPILAPTFTKCPRNLAEMEPWYDQWLRAAGCAVVRGPSDFAGLIPDVAVSDTSPPKRHACTRLSSRITLLSDGRMVSCEEDAAGRQTLGQIGKDSLQNVWRKRAGALREDHREGRWNDHPLCGKCRAWHRP